jgi:hypothetical protein
MTLNYDSNLRKYIVPSNNKSKIPVLNQHFADWEKHISENLRWRSPSGGYKYVSGLDEILFGICKEHTKSFEKGILAKDIIMLTHPFYMHLTHMDELTDENMKKDAEQYISTLFSFLNLRIPSEKASIIAFETVHHYAAFTSLLLEEGLIHKIFFSEYDRGALVDSKEFGELSGSNFYVGGSYNELCLLSSFEEIAKIVDIKKNVFAISELCLNSPQNCTCLKPEEINVNTEGDTANEISLNEVIKKFKEDDFRNKNPKKKWNSDIL